MLDAADLAVTDTLPPDLFGGSLPRSALGWSVNRLATELRVDRRTVTARLADVVPVGQGSSGPVYALADAARAIFGEGGGRKTDAYRERILAAQAETAELDLAAKRGELVDANAVRDAALTNARIEREALLSWPARVAPGLAADLGLDLVTLNQALDAAVRVFMEERANDAGICDLA